MLRGRRSGLCVKGRWGGEVRRPAGRPGSRPRAASSLRLSPAACRPPQLGRAGHVGASVTPSLTHSHTPARTHRAPASRALSLADTQALTSRSVPAPGQRPPPPSPEARPWLAAASLQTAPLRPGSQPPGPNPSTTAATVGTWKQPEAPDQDTLTVPTEYWIYRSRIHKTLSP